MPLPTTTQASMATYRERFERHVAAGSEVVCISISSGLSGSINAAQAAVASIGAGTIRVFDSRTVSGGLLLQVLAAAELARQGRTAGEIVAALEALRSRQALYAAIPDLSHAVRTGRISKATAMIGGIMKLSPVIALDETGKVAQYARVRTFHRALETLVEATVAHVGECRARIAIVHARAARTASMLREQLLARLPRLPERCETLETGPVIAVHAGPGAAGIFSIA
jgi:DegV family protein with EDD domain